MVALTQCCGLIAAQFISQRMVKASVQERSGQPFSFSAMLIPHLTVLAASNREGGQKSCASLDAGKNVFNL